MTEAKNSKRSQWGIVLTIIFLLAMFMGPGPGLNLVNPGPSNPNVPSTVLGLPIIYFWGLLWYVVQVTVVTVAYFTVWQKDGDL